MAGAWDVRNTGAESFLVREHSIQGATVAIQAGGFVKDEGVIGVADERDIAMVFAGARHSRH